MFSTKPLLQKIALVRPPTWKSFCRNFPLETYRNPAGVLQTFFDLSDRRVPAEFLHPAIFDRLKWQKFTCRNPAGQFLPDSRNFPGIAGTFSCGQELTFRLNKAHFLKKPLFDFNLQFSKSQNLSIENLKERVKWELNHIIVWCSNFRTQSTKCFYPNLSTNYIFTKCIEEVLWKNWKTKVILTKVFKSWYLPLKFSFKFRKVPQQENLKFAPNFQIEIFDQQSMKKASKNPPSSNFKIFQTFVQILIVITIAS